MNKPILRKHQARSADATSTRETEYADRLVGLQTVW